MAPKRPRRNVEDPPVPQPAPQPQPNPAGFDDFRFMCLEAETFHNEKMALKAMVMERGITVTATPVATQIRQRRWQTLCQQPRGGNATLVREFYANYPFARQGVLRLRGVDVPIGRTRFNEYYGLHDIVDSGFRSLIGGNYRSQIPQIYSRITGKPLASVRLHTKIAELKIAKMTKITKAWHYFIIGKLVPSAHHASCDNDKAVLNYAIQTGLTIDVGELMHIQIEKARRFKRTGLYYPSAITAICYAAGVPALGTDELCGVREVITTSQFNGYNISSYEQAGYIPDPLSEPEQEHDSEHEDEEPVRPPSPSPRRLLTFAGVHARMDDMETHFDARFTQLGTHFNERFDQMEMGFATLSSQMTNISELIQSMSRQWQISRGEGSSSQPPPRDDMPSN